MISLGDTDKQINYYTSMVTLLIDILIYYTSMIPLDSYGNAETIDFLTVIFMLRVHEWDS